jgi:uncharacterized protein YjbI with pentapeptide repeats
MGGLFWLLAGVGAGVIASWVGERRVFVGEHPLEGRVAQGERIDKAVIALSDMHESQLERAQLPGAVIGLINLEEASLRDADLSRAIFGFTNCEEVEFTNAELNSAVFGFCNLEEADFSNARLRGAIFDACNLRDANFEGADLTGAQMKNCQYDGVTLPDGEDWSATTDWARFTETGHPQYWRAG